MNLVRQEEEKGGGNKITEQQIKGYLKQILGPDCPQPTWGLPNGWGDFIASE